MDQWYIINNNCWSSKWRYRLVYLLTLKLKVKDEQPEMLIGGQNEDEEDEADKFKDEVSIGTEGTWIFFSLYMV